MAVSPVMQDNIDEAVFDYGLWRTFVYITIVFLSNPKKINVKENFGTGSSNAGKSC